MSGKSAHKPKWSHYFPDHDPIWTVEQLLRTAERRGVALDHGTLRHWQARGILPLPVRHGLPNQEGNRAFYPPVALDFIEKIRDLQRNGMNLNDIASVIGGMLREGNTPKAQVEADTLGLLPHLTNSAQILESETHTHIRSVIVTFVDDTGHSTTFAYPMPDSAVTVALANVNRAMADLGESRTFSEEEVAAIRQELEDAGFSDVGAA